MSVMTNEFSLTRRDFFMVLLREVLRRTWWLVLVPLVLLPGMLTSASDTGSAWPVVLWAAIFLFAGPAFLLLSLWRQACHPRNRLFFLRRRHELDDEFLHTRLEDGSAGKVALSSFVRLKTEKDAFKLFTTARQFVHIPFSAFSSEADRAEFAAILARRGLGTSST
jgi:hypothetical protein